MTLEINTKIPLNHKTVNISKMLKVLSLNHIDGATLTSEQRQKINSTLEEYYKKVLEPIKTFDGIVFQEEKKVINLCGSAYIQAITENNENSWCWESVDLDHYSIISEIKEKGIIQVLKDQLKKLTHKDTKIIVGLYYFCIKHGQKFNANMETLKDELKERIKDDINALQYTYFTEGFQDDYLMDKYDSEIHKESYLYTLLDEATEEYEGSSKQQDDYENAKIDVLNKWLKYSDDTITKEVIDEIKKE